MLAAVSVPLFSPVPIYLVLFDSFSPQLDHGRLRAEAALSICPHREPPTSPGSVLVERREINEDISPFYELNPNPPNCVSQRAKASAGRT